MCLHIHSEGPSPYKEFKVKWEKKIKISYFLFCTSKELICKKIGNFSKSYNEPIAGLTSDSSSAKYSALSQLFSATIDEYLCIYKY